MNSVTQVQMCENEDKIKNDELEKNLMNAIKANNLDDFTSLLAKNAKSNYQEEENGRTLLMEAVIVGNKEMVLKLLEQGAPWNALDKYRKNAGDYAIENSNQVLIDILLNSAVRAEMILGNLENRMIEKYSLDDNTYLTTDENVEYDEKNLIDKEKNHAVMMKWEEPLMEIHAKVISSNLDKKKTIRVLNIGFGLGLIDTEIQKICKDFEGNIEHCIIEAHPTVLDKMKSLHFDSKPNVTIYEGKWQDIIQTDIGKFDGIFFDTVGIFM